MALAKNIVLAGFSPGQADGIGGTAFNTGIVAAGAAIAAATALTADVNFVGTATNGQGVQLYNGAIGDSQIVFNDGTSATIVVYPPTGSRINGLAASSGVNLSNNTMAEFIKVTATRWICNMSA
jgi:hypothetical protein